VFTGTEKLVSTAGSGPCPTSIGLERGTFRSLVKASKTYGRRVGVVTAPTVFVDGKRLDGKITSARLEALLPDRQR
jgi:hypothetical protein